MNTYFATSASYLGGRSRVLIVALVLIAGSLAGAWSMTHRQPSPPDVVVASGVDLSAETGLAVSGHRVGALDIGARRVIARETLSEALGAPDSTVRPTVYARISGQSGWYADANDTWSAHWSHRVMASDCWGDFCVYYGGRSASTLRLRGWDLSSYGDRAGSTPDVHLAGSGLRLGDPWKAVRAAYPHAIVAGGEGNALTIRRLPWHGVFDGVGEWRLFGNWDYQHPHRAPARAAITRLSGGYAPETPGV